MSSLSSLFYLFIVGDIGNGLNFIVYVVLFMLETSKI